MAVFEDFAVSPFAFFGSGGFLTDDDCGVTLELSEACEKAEEQGEKSRNFSMPEGTEQADTELQEAPKQPDLLKNAPTLIAGDNPKKEDIL